MTTCIRKPGSEWTMCRCDPCRADMARKAKKRRHGLPVTEDVRDKAWQRIQGWDERGYTAGVIAAMTGLADRTVMPMIYASRDGRRHKVTHATARKIVAAPERPVASGGWIPSLGTVRRLQALTVMGWSMAALAERCGIQESTLHTLRNPKHTMTRPRFAEAVRALYDELSGKRGPCQYAATRALRKGWAPPAAWDDIDNPTETPQGVGRSALRLACEEVAEEVEHLLRFDPLATADHLAERMHYADRTSVTNPLRRAGRTDLLATLARNAELASPTTPRRTA